MELWREDELSVWLIFDEAGRCKSLDRLVVAICSVCLAASTAVCSSCTVLLHAASTSTICFCLATPSLYTETLRSIQNWPVSCASAKIAIESFLDIVLGGRVGVAEESIQAHDNSWCTESTLAAIPLCYPLLCWMWPLDVSNPLYCNDMLAVDTN